MIIWGFLVTARLVSLQVLSGKDYENRINRVSRISISITPRRGKIIDRNGRILALSVSAPSVCAYPPFVSDPAGTAAALAPLLRMDEKKILDKLTRDSEFVWLARQVTESTGDTIFHKDLDGIGIRKEYRRVYPHGMMAGKILGTVGLDQQGLAALEYEWNSHLLGEPGTRVMLKDARRNGLDLNILLKEPVAGKDLRISLDAGFQFLAEREVERGFKEHECRTAVISIVNPWTGEILAHAQYPPSDPRSRRSFFKSSSPDWLATGVYEPGSTFKPVAAALALKHKLVVPSEMFSGGGGKIECAGRTIRDHEIFQNISFSDALIHSSNVVFAQVGMRLPRDIFYRDLVELGFGEKTGIDLPGENAGLLPELKQWRESSPAYMALGQELAVTNAQMIRVYSALATDGRAPVLHLHASRHRVRGRIFSPDQIRYLKETMLQVVQNGTGRRASVPWVSTAGKTGTAQKPLPGLGYVQGHYISSFIGWFPVHEPRYLILVMLDEPRGKFYGGEVAAPIFSRLTESICVAEEIVET